MSPLLVAALVACDDPAAPRGPGSIFISTSASVLEPGDFYEYVITVDNGSPHSVFVFEDESYQVNGLAPGAHTVRISGVPTPCDAGERNRTVNLQGDDTALVVFSISCPRTTGDVRVTVNTTGPDQDLDGYLVLVNSQPYTFAPVNGQASVMFLHPGTYSISLGDVAPNCSPTAASQSVTVLAGVEASVTLGVTCTAVANAKLVVSSSGTDGDADGVTFKVGQGAATRATSGTSFVRLAAGQHSWELGDIQPNCTLNGPSSGSFTAAGGDTVTIDASMTCTTVGYGTATTVATDAAADTLANPSSASPAAFDAVQLTTRYAENWLILVMRFAKPVPGVGLLSVNGLQGYIELDTDENASTGSSPVANSFGGSAQIGVDYGVILFEATSSSVRLQKALGNETIEHRVPLAIEGDSVIVRIPLSKLGGDDGNLAIAATIGTTDRPTDIVPNSGAVLARQPSSAIIASLSSPSAGRGVMPLPSAGRRAYIARWKKR